MRSLNFRINHFGLCQSLIMITAMQKKKKDLEHDQLLRERDEQVIRRGLGQPY